ncbi:MAG: hypothetical protein HRJ53_02910 [Acidobacteria bacterium Pan2503]|uniref:Uncharacterized protein n=1 Tax=Candidatus Acidiferrum panamense TaxID=2741543 RepID=A0A7V8SVI3_9BACT|nr:hypothetical protein [Candidatus Acidoferrum panamensis]
MLERPLANVRRSIYANRGAKLKAYDAAGFPEKLRDKQKTCHYKKKNTGLQDPRFEENILHA